MQKARWASSLLELLFPGGCLLCGADLLFSASPLSPICVSCRSQLQPLKDAGRCRICSIALISERETCTRCRERSYHFEQNVSLFEYRGLIKELLYQFKFNNRRRLAPVLAELYSACLHTRFSGVPLVPAPGNPSSVRRRGWDPMMEVARILEKGEGFIVHRLLSRRRGAPQKTLSYEQRLKNLEGTVILTRKKAPDLVRVVLLDDVFTTGATASECARVLRQAGASSIEVLTLAIDEP